MSEQQGTPPQAPTFRTGADFLNAHLNMAMRLVELAASKNPDQLTPMMALELAAAHTELAQVGAIVAVSETLFGLQQAVDRLTVQFHEANEPFVVVDGEKVPVVPSQPLDDPMVAHSPERPL